MFTRRSSRESSPHPLEASKQEMEALIRELENFDREKNTLREPIEKLGSEVHEHEREREKLKKIGRKIDEELSAINSAGDGPSETVEALAARTERLAERVSAFQEREEEFRQDATALEEAVKKNSERVTEISKRTTEEASQLKHANVELNKMVFETFKLIATLDTGVLIAMTAITVGITSDPSRLTWFYVSCVFVFLSILSSVQGCLIQALRTTEALYSSGRSLHGWWIVSLSGSLLGLTIGIGLFANFIVLNLN